ncbi:hypothetical protein AKJ16_DCAP03541, partial [Drosera capensis]
SFNKAPKFTTRSDTVSSNPVVQATSAGVVLSLVRFPPSPLSSPFSPHTRRIDSSPHSSAPVAEHRRRPPHTAAKSQPDTLLLPVSDSASG